MKYLEAKRLQQEKKGQLGQGEHKMQDGVRFDQSEFRSNPPKQPKAESKRFVNADTEKLANRYGINAADVQGTGPGGIITTKDVKAAKSAQISANKAEEAAKTKAENESKNDSEPNS